MPTSQQQSLYSTLMRKSQTCSIRPTSVCAFAVLCCSGPMPGANETRQR